MGLLDRGEKTETQETHHSCSGKDRRVAGEDAETMRDF